MSEYAEHLARVRSLLAEWRELLRNEADLLASGDPNKVLDCITRKGALPHQLHHALVEAAAAGCNLFGQEAEREQKAIAEIDNRLEPLLRRLAELQAEIDRLTRLRRGHDHRLAALKGYAEQARGLTGLPAERVSTPEDAEAWLGKMPAPETPPEAQAVRTMFDY